MSEARGASGAVWLGERVFCLILIVMTVAGPVSGSLDVALIHCDTPDKADTLDTPLNQVFRLVAPIYLLSIFYAVEDTHGYG